MAYPLEPNLHQHHRPPRGINVRFLLGIIALAAVLVALVMVLHYSQKGRIAAFFIKQSRQYAQQGRYEDAIRYLRLYLAMTPRDADAQVRLALYQGEQGTSQGMFEAQTKLLQALRLDANRHDLRAYLTELCLRRGDEREALVQAEELKTRAVEQNPSLWSLIARVYESDNRLAEALEAHHKAVAADPRNLASQQRILDLTARLERDPRTRATQLQELLDQLLAANPKTPMAYLIAYVARRDHHLPNPEVPLEQALQLAPNDLEVLLMAVGDRLTRQPQKALVLLERLHQLYPQDRRVLLLLGKQQAARGNIESALPLWEQGLSLSGNSDPDFAWRLAELLIEKRAFTTPQRYLAPLAGREVYQPALQFLRGRQEMLAGDLAAARTNFEQGLRLLDGPTMQPASPELRGELRYKLLLGMAGVLFPQGYYADALNAVQAILGPDRADEQLPRTPLAWVMLGGFWFELGEYERAAETFREALRQPNCPSTVAVERARALIYTQWQRPVAQRSFQTFETELPALRRLARPLPGLVAVEAEAHLVRQQLIAAAVALTAGVQAFADDVPLAVSLVRVLTLAAETPSLSAQGVAAPGWDDFAALPPAGRLERAQQRALQASKRFGLTVPLRLTRAGIAILADKTPEAERLLGRGLSEAADPAARAALYVALAETALTRGDTAACLRHLQQGVTSTACHPIALAALVDWYAAHGQLESLDTLAQQLTETPSSPLPLWRWVDAQGLFAARAGLPALLTNTLETHLGALRGEQPYWWATHELEGQAALLRDSHGNAVARFRRVLLTGPVHNALACWAVDTLLTNGLRSDGQDVLNRFRMVGFPSLTQRRLALMLQLDKQPTPAMLAQARRLTELDPDNLLLQRWYAGWLFLAEKNEEAIAWLRQQRDRHASEEIVWLSWAAARRQGQPALSLIDLLADTKDLAPEIKLLVVGQFQLLYGLEKEATEQLRAAATLPALSARQFRFLISYFSSRDGALADSLLAQAKTRFPKAYWLRP